MAQRRCDFRWLNVMRVIIAVVMALVLAAPASAHFQIKANSRTVHVEHADGGMRVYLRVSLALAVAGLDAPAPYTRDALEIGQVVHYLDADAVERDPSGLGRLVADAHRFAVQGRLLAAAVEAVHVYHVGEQPPFATLADAKAALADMARPRVPIVYVDDAVIDVRLFYATSAPVARYDFSNARRTDPSETGVVTMLLDHRQDAVIVFRAKGKLDPPLAVGRSRLEAARTFVIEGIWHIWEGADHLLLVLCLIVGAVGFANLLWQVTGFTLGHTATLIAGFVGFRPSGAWFIPLIEAAIAASIIYAGVRALRRPGAMGLGATTLIGLLHGFGFSFMLHEILRLDAPDLWTSLLSFNFGVEIGQVAIVAGLWPILILLDHRLESARRAIRLAVVAPCIAVAAVWTGQRALALVHAVTT
jgi:hypothetical protein